MRPSIGTLLVTGTAPTAGAVFGILQHCVREHNVSNPQACTMAAVHTTGNPREALSRYAIATKFAATESSEMPYVRIVLLLQGTDVWKWKSNGEHLFRVSDLGVKEAHFIRSYDFQDPEERYCTISEEDQLQLQGVMAFTRFPRWAIMNL